MVYIPFYRPKKFSQKISFDGGCLEVGLWRGTGVYWIVKQGYRVEDLTVATLRDVRLFRCKRFEGCLSSDGRIGTFTKKGLLFRLRSYCFGSLYRDGARNKRTSFNKGKNRGKNIRFSMLKSYVI